MYKKVKARMSKDMIARIALLKIVSPNRILAMAEYLLNNYSVTRNDIAKTTVQKLHQI